MKKLLGLVVLGLLSLSAVGCSKVPAGEVGVKVYLLGGNKGVDNEVLGTGRYWIGINEELYTFPLYQINYTFTQDKNEGSKVNEEFTFQTAEGMVCEMDLGVALKFDREKVSKMFQTYRKGPEEIRSIVVRNAIRDALNKAASTMGVEAVYGSSKAALMDSTLKTVQAQLNGTGIIIENISLIGAIRLPPSVKEALDQKVSATQRAQQRENELREAEAQAKKVVAQAQGEAEANKIKMSSLTVQIIEWQRLQNELEAIRKWNGILPSVTGGTVPFINVK